MALLLLAAAGCGSGMCPVEGQVVFKGTDEPVTEGLVTFEPLDEHIKVSARGAIRSDGTFRLGTYKDADGLPEGRYRAMVIPPVPPNPDRRPPPTFHRRYERFDTSPLEFTVTRSGPNKFKLEVEKP